MCMAGIKFFGFDQSLRGKIPNGLLLRIMYSKAEKTHLFIIGIAALICSRGMFFFFDDPEGPNLLVVMGMAVVLFGFSVTVYSLLPFANPRKLWLTIFIQALFTFGLFLCLR